MASKQSVSEDTPPPQHLEKLEPGDDGVDHVAEKKLVRKLDLHIVPIVMLLYIFSFLDRVNIGNARLYGLEKDLGLKGNQYLIALSVLFATYVTFEVPSNLVLKKFRPSRYIATVTTIWGIIASLTGIVHSFGSLIACRILLGVFEAGLFPGLAVYLTFFYGRKELALRIGYLFVSAAIAGACGGLLAYGIGHLDGVQGLRGWRWILIIEGMPTFVLGISCFWLLPDNPETAYFLNAEEKQLMITRRSREAGQTKSAQEFHWKDVREAFKDWKVVAMCFAQFGTDTMLYGFSTFLPTIIQGLGKWTTAEVQALTIPVYAVGAIAYLIAAKLSDMQQIRSLYAVVFGAMSIIGYGILMSNAPSGVHYFGCFVVALGLYVAVGLPLAWLPNNCPRYGKRTTATGLQLTLGNCSGIMIPFLYPPSEGPRYIRGHAVTLSMVGYSCIVYSILGVAYWRINKNRRAGKEVLAEDVTKEEALELGDKSCVLTPCEIPADNDRPTFQYVI